MPALTVCATSVEALGPNIRAVCAVAFECSLCRGHQFRAQMRRSRERCRPDGLVRTVAWFVQVANASRHGSQHLSSSIDRTAGVSPPLMGSGDVRIESAVLALAPTGERNQPSAIMPAVKTRRAYSTVRVSPAFTTIFLFCSHSAAPRLRVTKTDEGGASYPWISQRLRLMQPELEGTPPQQEMQRPTAPSKEAADLRD
jgi:hypothetical protein